MYLTDTMLKHLCTQIPNKLHKKKNYVLLIQLQKIRKISS